MTLSRYTYQVLLPSLTTLGSSRKKYNILPLGSLSLLLLPSVYILPKAEGEGVGKIRLFFKNSRKNKEFLGKISFFG